jgi:hypothetical protein
MKKIYKFLVLAISLGFIFGCEEDLLVYDTPEGFVQFTTSSSNTTEDGSPIVATILLGSGSNPSGVSIPFSITTSDASRYTISPASGTIEIPAGQFSADITITPIDNLDADGNVNIELALGSGSIPVGIGGEGNFLTTSSLTIIDNDCPFDVNEFAGSYDLTMTLANGFIYAAGTYEELTTTLQVGTEPNTLVDIDFGYLGASGRTPARVPLLFDESTATVRVQGSAFTFADGSTVTDATYAYGASPNQRYLTGDGEGQLLTCSKSFTVNALIRRQDGSVGQILTLTYTKK